MNNSDKKAKKMSIENLKNWKDGGNNYVLSAESNGKWIGFQINAINTLITSFGDNFNIVLWIDSQNEKDYYCIPFNVLKHLFIEEYRTEGQYSKRWTAIIKNNQFMMQGNSKLSVDISSYYSLPLISENSALFIEENSPQSLEETINDIKDGFNEWRYHNEESVKQGIILPILQALGWKTSDTREVYPEHNLKGGRADYVLYKGINPEVLIEVKSLDRHTKENEETHKTQAKGYAEKLKTIKKIIITDGLYWRFYILDKMIGYIKLGTNINNNTKSITDKFEELLQKDNNKSWEGGFKSLEEEPLTLYDGFERKSVEITLKSFSNNPIKISHKMGDKEETNDTTGWKGGYRKFLDVLYGKYPEKINGLLESSTFIGSVNNYFVKTTKNHNDYVPVGGGKLYANAKMGPNGYAKMMRHLLQLCEIWSDKIKIQEWDKNKNDEKTVSKNYEDLIYIKTITKTDLEYGILSVNKEGQKKLSPLFDYKGQVILINGDSENKIFIKKDTTDNTLRFGWLDKWYDDYKIKVGDVIEIQFDKNEFINGKPVIHLELV